MARMTMHSIVHIRPRQNGCVIDGHYYTELSHASACCYWLYILELEIMSLRVFH